MNNLKGKKAVVTGGAMGIGLETSRRLLKEGVDVTIWDMNDTAMESAREELAHLDGKLYTHKCDVSDRDRVFELAETAKNEMGRVDILVNNAGFLRSGPFCDQPIENAIKVTDVNLNAIYYTTYAFLPDMLERNSGWVVNISSSAGFVPVPDLAVYCATKYAVLGFTEAIRLEAIRDKKQGVNFSSIHPHFIKEGMFEGGKLNFLGNLFVPRLKNHDVIAKAIVECAIKKNHQIVKRPRTMQIALIGRGLLPYAATSRFLRMMGVTKGMKHWVGRPGSEHAGQ
ncbi:MAG: SDR family NAD(P)-dependent oxidoreductase, partial [Desulfobacterales bacterium]|nr:SDR family NAD(P)-dependent oxidoreductase [Desulfobacterales bacterium]